MPLRFQHYEVATRPDGSLWELGRGAMGVTYRAVDTNLRSPVALKVVNPELLQNERARIRFLREARSAALLRHPNVATVFHLGADEAENFFYAMELVEGETFEELVARHGKVAPADALELTLQVTRALAAAFDSGLIHRDIKPSNLMLVSRHGEAIVKVIDFGLAKATGVGGSGARSSAAVLSREGAFAGTPLFASPEQLDGLVVDARSDIYSLGTTLWFLLTGEHLFKSPSVARIISDHLVTPPPAADLRGLPRGVTKLVLWMLEKKPGARPQNPIELRDAITLCLRDLPPAKLVFPTNPDFARARASGGDDTAMLTSMERRAAADAVDSQENVTPLPEAPVSVLRVVKAEVREVRRAPTRGRFDEFGFLELCAQLDGQTGEIILGDLPGLPSLKVELENGAVSGIRLGNNAMATRAEMLEKLVLAETTPGGSYLFVPGRVAPPDPALAGLLDEARQEAAQVAQRAASIHADEQSFRFVAPLTPEWTAHPVVAAVLHDGRSPLERWTNAEHLSRALGISRVQARARLAELLEFRLVRAFEDLANDVADDPAEGWFYLGSASEECGPVPAAEFREFIRQRKVSPTTLVWCKGLSGWLPYEEALEQRRAEPAEGGAAPDVEEGCKSCGKKFRRSDMTHFDGNWICGPCRPAFFASLGPRSRTRKSRDSASASDSSAPTAFRRLLAWLLDALLYFSVVRAAEVLGGVLGRWPLSYFISPGVLVGEFLGGALWNALFLWRAARTPGKWAVGLKVVTLEGTPLTIQHALVRTIFGLIPGGQVLLLFRSDRRALHDLVAGTRVESVARDGASPAGAFASPALRTLLVGVGIMAAAALVFFVQRQRLRDDFARWTEPRPKPPAAQAGRYRAYSALVGQWSAFSLAAPGTTEARLELNADELQQLAGTVPPFDSLRGAHSFRVLDGKLAILLHAPMPDWLPGGGSPRFLNATARVKPVLVENRWSLELEGIEAPFASPENLPILQAVFTRWADWVLAPHQKQLSNVRRAAVERDTLVLSR